MWYHEKKYFSQHVAKRIVLNNAVFIKYFIDKVNIIEKNWEMSYYNIIILNNEP